MDGDRIVVVEYDARWVSWFDELAERLRSAVGEAALAIEHVGSTSVPGLAAKPIIDIDVVVEDAAALAVAIERLAAIGYVHIGDLGVAGREAFRHPPSSIAHHLYVCLRDGLGLKNHLALRDHLRADPEAVRAYGSLKLDLAARFPSDIERYVDGKTDFILGVLEARGLSATELRSVDGANRLACVVRDEAPPDEPRVATVVRRAFGGEEEVRIVAALRERGEASLALVGEVDGIVVGHAMASPIRIEPPAAGRWWGLGPVAVDPDYQRRGVGSRLVRTALERAREFGVDGVFVLGDPAYYRRFGFVTSAIGNDFGATDAFMVVELRDGRVGDALAQGPVVAHYASGFGGDA